MLRRSGWWHVGVRDPESVAEHTMRVAQLAAIIAAEEGADCARAALLALWHDSQETRTGDLPHTASAYLTKPDLRQITADQTQNLPERSREMVRGAVGEYESRQSTEALCARTPTSWRCFCRPSSTAISASIESTAGSNRHARASRP